MMNKPESDSKAPTMSVAIRYMLIGIVIMFIGGFGSDYLPDQAIFVLISSMLIGSAIGVLGMRLFLAALAAGSRN